MCIDGWVGLVIVMKGCARMCMVGLAVCLQAAQCQRHGNQRGYTLMEAVKENRLDKVTQCLSLPSAAVHVDDDGNTLLHWACFKDKDGLNEDKNLEQEQKIEIVKALIQNGVNLDAQNKKKQTPLHLAVTGAHACKDIVKLLLEKGANPCIKDKNKYTPFDYQLDDFLHGKIRSNHDILILLYDHIHHLKS